MAPPLPPGGGGPDRKALLVTLGVLGAIVAVVLIAALASGGGDNDGGALAGPSTTERPESPTTAEVDATERPPDTEPPPDTTEPDDPVGPGDVSALEVGEHGFSTYTDPIGDEPSGSFGFLVENTGDETVVGAPLSVTILDEAGGILETTNFTVGVIKPGETLGYGGELIEDPVNGIGDIEVQVGESTASYDAPAEGTLTASNITTTGDEYGRTTIFSVSSTYTEQVDYASPCAIYRDSGGRIIGGGEGIIDFLPPGGQQNGQVDIFAPIPDIATTEVYVDAGPFY